MMDQSEKSIRLLWAALLLVGAGFLLAAAQQKWRIVKGFLAPRRSINQLFKL